ncbi:MAG: glycosyltransferase [Promethearchaeota archaeon]
MIDEIANQAYHLTTGLTRKGHEVYVLLDVLRNRKRLLFSEKVPQGAKLIWIRPVPFIKPRALALFFPMLFTILRLRPKIIHVQYLWSQFFIGFIAAKLLRVPIVGTAHGWEVMDVPKWPVRGKIQRVFLKYADILILTAEFFRDYLKDIVKSERMVYIPRMIDTDMFRPGIPCDDLIEKYGNRIVTFIARLNKIKTPYKTIEAFRKALDAFPDAQLLVLGIGPEEQPMREAVKTLQMEESVHFLGEVPNTEIPRYLNASKVEARNFNPLTPDLGISHLEALSCETPLLTYVEFENVGGIIICLEVEEIAEAMIKILGNEKYRQMLGAAGRKYVIENFSIDAATRKTIRVYKSVLYP